MTPYHHALASTARYGGELEDYLPLHQWFDETKAFFPDVRHRALRHHAEGIFLAERLFGVTLPNSSGRRVPVRLVAEQHVKEDLGWIPTAQDWLACLKPAPWMFARSRTLAQSNLPPESAAAGGANPKETFPDDCHARAGGDGP
jgi:hypothetical protein